jgi:hypothetical protein
MCGKEAGATWGRAHWWKRSVSLAPMSRWLLPDCGHRLHLGNQVVAKIAIGRYFQFVRNYAEQPQRLVDTELSPGSEPSLYSTINLAFMKVCIEQK